MTKSLVMALAAVVGLSGTACAPNTLVLMAALGGSKKETKPKDDLTGYIEASCLYGYSEGPNALVKPANKQIQASYFGKKYDVSLLNPVLAANGSEVVRFAETTGVRFYKTSPYKEGTCGFSSALPSAPSDLENKFSEANQNNGVLGLYLSKNSTSLPSTKGLAAIIVRSDANKWVLVHEYMHHLFDSQVQEEGLSGDAIKTKALSLYSTYGSQKRSIDYKTGTSRKTAVKETYVTLKNMNDAMIELVKQYFLEEMTIETILGEKLENGQLKMVLDKQRLNGAAYVISSAKKTADFIDQLDVEISTFKRSYYEDLDYADYSALSVYSTKFQDLRSQMSRLRSRAKDYLSSKGLDYNGVAVVSEADPEISIPVDDHAGCSHGKDADEILEIIRNGHEL
ncbi:hypothetical protein [Bdellovibrio bacteriovorus]|nr:hypothetical protein [Bdellovibrio bacteriovorus]